MRPIMRLTAERNLGVSGSDDLSLFGVSGSLNVTRFFNFLSEVLGLPLTVSVISGTPRTDSGSFGSVRSTSVLLGKSRTPPGGTSLSRRHDGTGQGKAAMRMMEPLWRLS